MTDRKAVRQFFGDAEHDFHLTPALVMELERRAGSGIGALYKRFLASDFGFAELTEIIRLGLIGGGMDPKDASQLVSLYSQTMTVVSLFLTAMPVMDALMTGAVQPVAKPRSKRTRR